MAYVKALPTPPLCEICRRMATLQIHNQWNAPLSLFYCQRHAAKAQAKADELTASEQRGPYVPRLGSAR